VLGPVYAADPNPQQAIDFILFIEGRRPKQQAVPGHLASKVFFGQRWPLIGKAALFTHQGDLSLATAAAQGIQQLAGGVAGTYYDNSSH
jgi:hypothetical protein